MHFGRWLLHRGRLRRRGPAVGVLAATRASNLPVLALPAVSHAGGSRIVGVHHQPHPDEEELENMAKDRTLATMCDEGRRYLQSTPGGTPDDYAMKQAMARAAPTHTALQQQQAISTLKIELQNRRRKK